MSNTYTQIHIQTVFAVQDRFCIIGKNWEAELYKYISGIVRNHNHKLLAINGMPDHLHLLFGLRPTQSLSDLMQDIKGDSSKWINTNGFLKTKFRWQEGYGAFSYSKSQVHNVIKYIKNQKEHHLKKTFTEEYRDMLRLFEVDFNEAYLFRPVAYER
ncbi:MAG: IS200/IS605 family transposase [Saprospiraceae bacterium]